MELKISYTVLLMIVSYCWDLLQAKQCVKRDSCSCVFDDGSGMIDLSPLRKEGSPLFMDKSSSSDTFKYSYSPCGVFDDVTCANVAACQSDLGNYLFYDIGIPDTMTFNYDGLNVMAHYTSKDGARETFVTLACDPSATTPSLDVFGETKITQYAMTLRSSAACVVKSSAPSVTVSVGLSAGTVILIIFVVVLALYLAAGITFNVVRHHSRGVEIIPNRTFWSTLPGLIKDGCAYSMGIVCRKRSVYVSM